MTKFLFSGWYVVFACFVGIATGWAVVVVFSFSSFAPLLHTEFGWDFASIGLAMTLFAWCVVITSPIVGWLIDCYGVRRVLLPSIALLGLVVCSMSMLNSSIGWFYAGICLMGILGAGTGIGSYSKVILGWFDKQRGLALGLGLSGVGVGAFIAPLFIEAVAGAHGWRGAYIALGSSIAVISGVVCFFLLRNSAAEMHLDKDGVGGSSPGGHGQSSNIAGFSVKEAKSRKVFWLMLTSFFLIGATMGGVLIHMKQLLIIGGIKVTDAARVLSLLGVAVIFGRILAGYLMDRIFAPYVAVAFFIGPIIGYFILIDGVTGFEAVIAMILIGLATGAEFDILSFFTSKYCGLKHFGVLFGWIFAAFQMGHSLGAYLTGYAIDQEHLPVLLNGYMVGLIVVCALLLMLGPYTDFSKDEADLPEGHMP